MATLVFRSTTLAAPGNCKIIGYSFSGPEFEEVKFPPADYGVFKKYGKLMNTLDVAVHFSNTSQANLMSELATWEGFNSDKVSGSLTVNSWFSTGTWVLASMSNGTFLGSGSKFTCDLTMSFKKVA
jgi:hypothetical protein